MAITKIQSNAFPTSIDLSNVDLTLGAGEVLAANIADSNITTAKIADSAVHTTKVADLAVTHAKLHTDMNLTSKTVVLPKLNQTLQLEVSDNSEFLNVTVTGNEAWAFKGASGNGIMDYVSFGISGGTQAMSWQEDGKVGIGTTSPEQNLHIKRASGSDTAGQGHILLDVADDGGPAYALRIGDTGDDGDFHIDRRFNGTWFPSLSIERVTGNVGIGDITPDYKLSINTTSTDSAFGIRYNDSPRLEMSVDGDSNYFKALSGQRFEFQTSVGTAWKIESAGHLVPGTTDTYDIGSTSSVVRNIYTGDLHLSNEAKTEGNEVDGTKGNWTIQEGEEHLYIINNKNGKKYRFALEEIQ